MSCHHDQQHSKPRDECQNHSCSNQSECEGFIGKPSGKNCHFQAEQEQTTDCAEDEGVTANFEPFPAKFRPVKTSLHYSKTKVHVWCLFPSATAISKISANRPPSTIHHQSRCCKIALRLT